MSPVSLARHTRRGPTGQSRALFAAGLLGAALLPAARAEEDRRDLALQEQALFVRQELLNQAHKRGERLAEFYRSGLGEDFGRQLRKQAQNLLAIEEKKETNLLDKSDRAFTELGHSGERLARELVNVEARLVRHQQTVDAAVKKGDTKATTQARLQVKYMRAEMLSLAKRVQSVDRLLGKALVPLSGEGPRLTVELRAAAMRHAGDAGKKALAMADAVGESKPPEAVVAVKAARQELEQFAAVTRRAHAAVEVYGAAEAARGFAQATSAAADSLREFAATAAAFLKAADPDLAPEVIRVMQQTTYRSAASLQEAREFSAHVVRAVAALKETPKTLVKALPHALKALDELQDGKKLVGTEEPGKAAERLTAAAVQLTQLARELNDARARLGLEGEKVAAVLAKEVDSLLRDKLPAEVQERFVRMHVDKVLPGLLVKARAAVEKALPPNTPGVRAIHEATLKEIEKRLGPDLLARVKLARAFGDGAADHPAVAPKVYGKRKQPPQVAMVRASIDKALRVTIDSKFANNARGASNLFTFTAPPVVNIPPVVQDGKGKK